MIRLFAIALLALAGCSAPPDVPGAQDRPTDLERAAIEAGLIADPANTDITGLYARETDRICIVPAAKAYRIGLVIDYGDRIGCAGSGVVDRVGDGLRITLDGRAGCSFDAQFDGDRIVLPGRVPDGCAALCARRVSIAGLEVERLSDSTSEASTLRDRRGNLLCQSGA